LSAVDTNILAACCRDNASFQPEGDEEQSQYFPALPATYSSEGFYVERPFGSSRILHRSARILYPSNSSYGYSENWHDQCRTHRQKPK
jgi:hypothetical protein